MKRFLVKLEGITPLLQHRMTEEALFGLLASKGKKKAPKEELLPRQIAEKTSYKNPDGSFYIPLDYVTGALIQTAADYKQSHNPKKSMKSIAGGIFRPITDRATLCDKKWKPIVKFEVDVRRGNNFKAGAVCLCRARFDDWRVKFEAMVDNSIVAPETVLQILEDAGRRCGIGSFRVANRGYFGQFQVAEWKEISSSDK